MADLKRVLDSIASEDRKQRPKTLNRRFVVAEGVSAHFGDICPLNRLVDLAEQYKFRVIIDDSLGFGVLGATGRGICEFYNLDVKRIDLYCGALDNSISAVGGFCVGSTDTVSHQRLSGAGYCFSASSPPYTSTAGIIALQTLRAEPRRIEQLRQNIKLARTELSSIRSFSTPLDPSQPSLFSTLPLPSIELISSPPFTAGLVVQGDEISPIIHLRLRNSGNYLTDLQVLESVQHALLEKSIVAIVPTVIADDLVRKRDIIRPSLRVTVSSCHSADELRKACQTIKATVSRIIA